MIALSHEAETIARGWLLESGGDVETAPLRNAVRILLEAAEEEVKRLRAAFELSIQLLTNPGRIGYGESNDVYGYWIDGVWRGKTMREAVLAATQAAGGET